MLKTLRKAAVPFSAFSLLQCFSDSLALRPSFTLNFAYNDHGSIDVGVMLALSLSYTHFYSEVIKIP